jgi:hypothetical protein
VCPMQSAAVAEICPIACLARAGPVVELRRYGSVSLSACSASAITRVDARVGLTEKLLHQFLTGNSREVA